MARLRISHGGNGDTVSGQAETGAARATARGGDGGRWRDLRPRVASALVLVPVALLCLWAGGFLWILLTMLAMAGMGWEWARMCQGGWRAQIASPIILVAVAALAYSMSNVWGVGAGLLGGLILLVMGALGLRLMDPRHPDWLSVGTLYIGIAGLALLLLRLGASGAANTVFVLVLVWASDIGAYMAGRLVGGPKLAPRFSPNKTWSGALGGLLLAALAGWVVAYCVGHVTPITMPLALVLAVASQAGDLLESWTKRRFGVKDSSRLIPGHGGVLDRLDGVLAAAPLAGVWLLIWGSGVIPGSGFFGGLLWQ